MDGKELAKYVDDEIANRGLKKKAFYDGTGISSATLSQWRTGLYNPSEDNVEAVGKFFGVQFSVHVSTTENIPADYGEDDVELLDRIHARPELKILMHNGAKATPEQIAQINALLESFIK